MKNILNQITERHRLQIEALPQLRSMLSGSYSKASYTEFMLQLYPIVSNFCPLMATAAGRCADRHSSLRHYLYEHIAEEQGHEAMVLTDLNQLDYPSANVPNQRPSAPVQAMLAFNYYAIDRIDPHCVLGMIYVLELTSAGYGAKVARSVAQAIDHPIERGFTFLDSHATLDDDHLAELIGLIQSIEAPLLQEKIIESINMNFYLLAQMIGALPKA
ncbi:MAG: hypothetical protein RLZZ375_544 [Pseudomonadota bacterium]|jgi:pyrroloquinoline quinone (PQQ) biosynthesis protein C